jgi:hypothetical protein
MIKKYFGQFLKSITRFKWETVYTVLIIASIIAIPFALWSEEGWIKLLFTYTLGTSLHELIFTKIENKARIPKP